MLFQIMHKAEANDFILKNPVRFAEKMHYREPPKRKEAFSAAEVSILMEKLPKDKIGLSIRLLLGTGMRTQELLALEPRHIAVDGTTIQIEQAINMHKGTAVVGTPKSRDSYRIVPIPESISGIELPISCVSVKELNFTLHCRRSISCFYFYL